jgi:hypothetical protein
MATRDAVVEVHNFFLFPFRINACVSFLTKELNCKQTLTNLLRGQKSRITKELSDKCLCSCMQSDMKSRTGWYPVQTGRRDGRVSSAQNVKLPSPSIPIPQAIAAFNSKRLSTIDMVYLLGM